MVYRPRKFILKKRWESFRHSPDVQRRVATVRDFFLNNLLLVGAIVVTLSLVYNTTNAIEKNSRLQTEANQIKAEIDLLAQEIRQKQLLEEYYQSDEFLELEARKQLGLVSEGEKVILVPEALIEDVEPVSQEPVEIDNRPRYRRQLSKWFDFLFRSEQ